jgi:hypothetical protein
MPQTTEAERFWSKVEATTVGCWRWKGGHRHGYGEFWRSASRRTEQAHRVMYEFDVGPIPPGFKVCHTCDNVGCVNPLDLFLGTQKDNVLDMITKGRTGLR